MDVRSESETPFKIPAYVLRALLQNNNDMLKYRNSSGNGAGGSRNSRLSEY